MNMSSLRTQSVERAGATPRSRRFITVAVAALGLKILQWLVLVVASVAGPWAGLPEGELLPLVLAGCWVISSAVWLWGRHWLGAASAVIYSALSGFVSFTELMQGDRVPWNVLTFAGSVVIVVACLLAVLRRELAGSRW
jgi:hypothetical protein